MTTRQIKWAALVLGAACVVAGCGNVANTPDVSAGDVPDADVADTIEIPSLVTNCAACHNLTALATPNPGAAMSIGEWTSSAAMGLVRVDPLFPEPGVWWGVPWPRRGHHAIAMDNCAGCHPLQADGTGHGLRVYPVKEDVFTGEKNCSLGCHGWIPESSTEKGFPDTEVPDIVGSTRPGELLAAGDNAHSRLWRQGARPSDQTAFRISTFQPGCGGCHNVMAEDHGAILNCLDCHDFQSNKSDLHTSHVVAAANGQARFDPEGATAGLSSCNYCHKNEGDAPLDRSRQSCHNCHLSAHQPLGADGLPQLWPQAAE
jgi:hypothetical protein